MDPQHDRVDEIFCRAADKATAQERSKYLDGACGDDPQLRARVERLLAAQSKVDSFLESPAPGAELGAEMGPTMADSGREPASSDRPLSEKPGTRIGPYKLLQKLGEGGMGVVYMAEQSEPVERRVALKIIKPGMDTRQVTARFEAERQALAMMDHPGIAHVLDAGTTESGRPFFAMELVKGVPITQYCDVKRLTLQQRLALFVDVCHAVQHAHQKGIIHRDIKPSNVMVAEYDDHAVPKVIDFGVAKAIQQQLTEKTMFTQMGQVVGTLEYMSPEQAKLNQMDIDTRSDIYSLGVLLYELLTGETPFDRQRLRSAAFDERLRIVREEEVLKPSTRLGSSEILPSVAANRHLEQRKLSAEVRGELDWIVMKAMEKERERRYPTAYEFAQDVRRFLADEPIQACSPSTVYRLRRFVRRNKRSVIAGACVSVSVILAAAFGLLAHLRSIEQANMRLMLIQANVAKRESDAKRLDAEVDALVEEAQRLCSGVFPDFHRAIELLDEAIIHRPSEGMLYFYRGNARYELGRYREAIADLNRSLEFVPADNQAAHWLLAHSFQQLGDRTSARMHLELAAAQQAEGVLPLVAAALAEPFEGRGIELLTEAIEQEPFNPLLYYYRGRIAYNLTLRNVSSQFYRIAIEDLEKAHRGRPTDLRIVETLCCCHVDFRFLDDSPQRSLARARALIDYWFAERSNDVGAFAALARWQLASDQPEEAVETCLSLSETSRSPLLLFQLGLAYRELAQHQQAVDAFSRAIQLDPELLGGGQSMAAIYAARSVSQFSLGRHELARHDLHQALEPSAQQTWTFFDWYSVVAAHRTLGDCDQGLVWCERFVESIPQCGQSWYLHGALLLDLGRQQEAQADFIKAIERNPHDHRPYDGLLGTYLSSRETEQAMIWCNRWVEFSPESNDAYRWRGLFHYHDKNYEPALRDLSKAVRLDPRDARSHYHRARTYLALKQYQEAAQDFDQSLQLDPSDTEVRLARARMQYDRGRYEMAVADYDAVLQRHSQDADVWWRRGETWRKLGRTEQALADLNKSLELDPHNATAYDRRGLVYAAFRRYSDAIADHKRALKLNPKEPWAHMHMVNAYLASGDEQAALEFCGQWMLDVPNSSEPHRLRAQVFYASENYQAALDELAVALQKNPRDVAALLLRGRVYAALHQHAKALADYNATLELTPGYKEVYYKRGVTNAKLRRYQPAIVDFTQAIEFAKADGWLHYHRADAYRNLGQWNEALADCEKAIQIEPDRALFHLQRGRVLALQGDVDAAMAEYERAFEIDPDEPYARHSVVSAHCLDRDYEGALAFCEQWLHDHPESVEAYRHRGLVHMLSSSYKLALDDFEMAQEQDPQDYLSLFYQGQTHLAINDRERGLELIRRSLEICPASDAADHQGTVGEFFGQRGQWELAITHFAESVRLDSLDVRHLHLLALVHLNNGDEQSYRATCDRMLQQHGLTEDPNAAELVALTAAVGGYIDTPDRLVALANQAVESRPNSACCRCTLGAVLHRVGRQVEALSQLQEAERLMDQSHTPLGALAHCVPSLLAMTHAQLGNPVDALRMLKKAEAASLDPPRQSWPFEVEPPKWSRELIARILREEAITAVRNDR